MRSLLLLDTIVQQLSSPNSSSKLSAITTDPSTNVIYAVCETGSDDGTTELGVLIANGNELSDPIVSWTINQSPNLINGSEIVSFRYLPESDSLVVVLVNGDIEQIFEPGNSGSQQRLRENVGAVEAGIKAAAWSPDEELLVIITGEDQLIEMTKDFEVLSEGPLRSEEFGEDAQVNVGWGTKSTQFHGSVGKSAASSSTVPSPSALQSSPDDDGLPRFCWRGDSAFFAISSLDALGKDTPGKRRIIRVFSRVAVLSSTSEPTSGLEHSLSWQPSGSIIASTQKLIGEGGEVEGHHVVFFERNGLRRYDFALREGKGSNSQVRALEWNADSTILAVWIQRGTNSAVQLWHRNNYYWYLKQEISPGLSGSAEMTALIWHPEKALELLLSTSNGIETYSMCWDTFASVRPAPNDDGAVAVVDGSLLKLTPFRLVNIPPPMSALVLSCPSPLKVPVHVSFSTTSSDFLCLYSNGLVELYSWPLVLTLPGKAPEEIKMPTLVTTFETKMGGTNYARQCAFVGEGEEIVVAVLQSSAFGASVLLIGGDGVTRQISILEGAKRLLVGKEAFTLEASDGTLSQVPFTATEDEMVSPSDDLSPLPEFCPWILHISLSYSSPVVGLSESGRLYCGSKLLANDATSVTSTPDFLIFTTFSHEVKFIPLFTLENSYTSEVVIRHTESLKNRVGQNETGSGNGIIKRAVERGSRLVTVVSSTTSMILQMPRGNLETVCPRPLVLRIVRQDLDEKRYKAAFLACRRHRIDLNILYDHNPALFRSQLASVITQIKNVDFLNLFLSGLKNEDVTVTMYRPLVPSTTPPAPTANKVNVVCDLVRSELEKRDVFHYANTILTAHVRKRPPDYESALRVLVELKAKDATRAEDAVKYIIFLSDANKLFDLALGMYDFALVLMIAQHSQKDPQEYLPFLRELRLLDTHVQRFRIDDHLEKYDSALRNLALATGPEAFEEALTYTKKHGLFEVALKAYKNDAVKYKIILSANADHLFTKHYYAEAGLLFALSGQPSKAMTAYQKGNAWQELFTLALSEGKRSAVEIKALAVDVAESLRNKRRFVDAGKVLLDYGRDVEGAVAALVEGTAYAEAIRLTTLYSKRDLVETHIKPGTIESQAKILDDIIELTEQVEKQVERLAELKVKRDANYNLYHCLEDPASAFDNVELQPDGASDAGTAFTRYTVAAPTVATTRDTRTTRTSVTKTRKQNLRKASGGKKGTVFEETYLLNSCKKLAETKLAEIQADTASLLPILLSLSSASHRSAAATLQADLTEFEKLLSGSIESLWSWREDEWKEEREAEWRAKDRGEFVEPGKIEEGREKVERPKISKLKYRIVVLDLA